VTHPPDSARAPRPADPGAPAVLLVVRHGRTPLTAQGAFSGSGGADPELSDDGRADAARVAGLLAGLVAGLVAGQVAGQVPAASPSGPLPDVGRVDHLVCSPLARTRQTARIIGDRLGLQPVADPAWQEIGFGAWDGLRYDEVAARWPRELLAWQGSATVAPPGGESLAAFAEQVRAARSRLVAAHPGRTVAVVTHATPARVVLQEALDAGDAALWRTRVSPGSVTAVRYWRDGGVEVVAVNHLPA